MGIPDKEDAVYSAFAEIYDQVMREVDYDSWARYILRLTNRFQIDVHKVLEMACGTGGHAIRLASLGYEVTGVDRSPVMLKIAQSKLERAGVHIDFRQGSMDSFSHLGLSHDFDLVTCLYDSLNYLLEEEELDRCFREIYAHLRPGGCYIFDVTTEYNLLQNFAGYTFAENYENASYIWENEYDIVKKICLSRVTVFTHRNGEYQKHVEFHRQKVYPTRFLTLLLQEVGFEVAGCYHDLTEKPAIHECERVHFICIKPEPA